MRSLIAPHILSWLMALSLVSCQVDPSGSGSKAAAGGNAKKAVARVYLTIDEDGRVAFDDLKALDAETRKFTRYFTLTHLHNTQAPADVLDAARLGVGKMINSLQRHMAPTDPKPPQFVPEKIVLPVAVNPEKTVLRIDLRHYGWTPESWEALIVPYPYSTARPSDKNLGDVQKDTGTLVPILRADWFVSEAPRPPLYYRVTNAEVVMRDLKDLENLRGVNFENAASRKVIRAGLGKGKSEITPENRVLERHEGIDGFIWRSFEFGSSEDKPELKQNILENPLDPQGAFNTFGLKGANLDARKKQLAAADAGDAKPTETPKLDMTGLTPQQIQFVNAQPEAQRPALVSQFQLVNKNPLLAGRQPGLSPGLGGTGFGGVGFPGGIGNLGAVKPENTGTKKAFDPGGTEVIYQLPNKLFAYYAADDTGVAITTTPDTRKVKLPVVDKCGKPTLEDGKPKTEEVTVGVEVGATCMECHGKGLRVPKNADEVRAHVAAATQGFTATDKAAAAAVYVEDKVFKDKITADNAAMSKIQEELLGIKGGDDPVRDIALQFRDRINIDHAAAEFGVRVGDFRAFLTANRASFPTFATCFVDNPTGSVTRQLFNDNYKTVFQDLHKIGGGAAAAPAGTAKPATPAPGLKVDP